MTIKLAMIGDSLGQGFQDGAIGREFPLRSFPAMIAESLGLSVGSSPHHGFRVPSIPGEGLPLDIVQLLQSVTAHEAGDGIQRTEGRSISGAEWPTVIIPRIAQYFSTLEDYYEVGEGSRPIQFDGTYHNLSSYGMTVFESVNLTSRLCDDLIEEHEGWFRNDVLGTPSGAKFRSAKMVLDPRGDDPEATQVRNLQRLAQDPAQCPDAFLLWLGANDCLGTVVGLEVNDMPSVGPSSVAERQKYNLTSAAQFRADYEALAARLDEILPKNTPVFVGTVPDVSVAPIAKGLGQMKDDVYDYYVRFFVDGKKKKPPPFHKHLKREDVALVQARIEQFNAHIRSIAEPRNSWHVVEIGVVLQQLAVRRLGEESHAEKPLRDYYAAQGRPDHPLLQLAPVPSLLTLGTHPDGRRKQGGLTSLDGVHPTTIGYGIAAEVFLTEMKKQGIPGADPARLDWTRIAQSDRLLARAPAAWGDFLRAATSCSLLWDTLFRTLSSRV